MQTPALLRTIAIVGAGFSGTVRAANLLRRANATPTARGHRGRLSAASLYGEYLQELLLAAELTAPPAIRLEWVRCGCTPNNWRLR